MKYICLVPDGMADYPIRSLSWRTPLVAAQAPIMKSFGEMGDMGVFLSIPRGTQAGSDVANMSIMGYDPSTQLTGRGALESAAMNIKLQDDELAFRCNLITTDGSTILDYSAGYIPSEEGHHLIDAMKEKFDGESVTFHAGNSFRNILMLRGDWISEDIRTTPPHDIVGQDIASYLPKALSGHAKRTEEKLRELILRSTEVLSDHPINRQRKRKGENPGNMIWPWSPGRRLRIRPFKDVWGLEGAAISAVDTVKGIAKSAGMDAPDVPGATGFIDTNYEGKARAALNCLQRCDLVYIHVEAIDEMGHSGDVMGKIRAIENFDSRLVATLLGGLERMGGEYRIAVIPDHYTPCTVRTHVRDPTPFVITGMGDSKGLEYNEENAKIGKLGLLKGEEFIRSLLQC